MRRLLETGMAAFAALAVAAPLAGSQGIAARSGLDAWQGIREVGFPAAAFVMLWALTYAQLRDNTRALYELASAIRQLQGSLGGRRRDELARDRPATGGRSRPDLVGAQR